MPTKGKNRCRSPCQPFGKSFGICEIARALLGKDAPRYSNSIYRKRYGPAALAGGFHQVPEEVLEGIMRSYSGTSLIRGSISGFSTFSRRHAGRKVPGKNGIAHPLGPRRRSLFEQAPSYTMEFSALSRNDSVKWDAFKDLISSAG